MRKNWKIGTSIRDGKSKSAYWKMKANGEEPVLMGTREGMVHILR